MRNGEQLGWRGGLCWEGTSWDAPTFSLFLLSAADNSKDLATELVHYGFIHEVKAARAPCHCQHARCVPHSLMPPALFPIWAMGPRLQLCAALVPLLSASLLDFSGLHTLLLLF